MPCAAGELCHLSTCTPKGPDGHQCQGGCGGRLHGICGEVEEKSESEINRGPTPEWVGWTVTGPSRAEGHLPWPGVLLVGELAQVPHYPER